MKAPRIKPFPLFVLESLFEQNNAAAVTSLLSFWEALRQFDGQGDAPQVAFDRLTMAVIWYGGSPTVVDQLGEQLAREKTTHPRIRMLPFLIAEPAIVELAEQVLATVPPSAWQYTPGRPISGALTKREVCAVLRVSTAELATLIRTGALPWPAAGGRQSYWALSRTLLRDDLLSIEAAAEQLGVKVPSFRSNWVITGIHVGRKAS